MSNTESVTKVTNKSSKKRIYPRQNIIGIKKFMLTIIEEMFGKYTNSARYFENLEIKMYRVRGPNSYDLRHAFLRRACLPVPSTRRLSSWKDLNPQYFVRSETVYPVSLQEV